MRIHMSFLFTQKKLRLKNYVCFVGPLYEREIAVWFFGVCRLTFYYDDHHAAAFCLDLYMLTGSQPKLFLYNY